jgi:hypothetical protein
MALTLGLHRDIRSRIPDRLMNLLLGLRELVYTRSHHSAGAKGIQGQEREAEAF